MDKLQKMIEVSMNAQNVRIDIKDFNNLYTDLDGRLDVAVRLTANKIQNIKPEPGEKLVKPRKYGV